MQETFLKLWEHAGRWEKRGGRLDAWLYRVAGNACFDRLRSRRRDAPEEAAEEIADEAPSAVERLAADDRARAVKEALDALPERQRIAMTLCHYQEMTNIEAAAAMATTVEAVEGLLSRARKTLRESLAARRQELLEGAE
jgi:RNA polymerase sigma-70 factor (ECF subfamily)